METILQQQLQLALEDLDDEKEKSNKLNNELRQAREYIISLQGKLSAVQAKSKELYDQIQNQSSDEEDALKDQCQKITQENTILKNEMQALTMRMSKEIEDRKKNEENLAHTLKGRLNECNR